jgi:hypothetical protein
MSLRDVFMMLEAIKEYIDRGFSLVPFNAIPPAPGETKWKKKPIVQWADRQKKAPGENEALSEFKKFPKALVGCVTGRISGICTLDIDDDEGRKIADEMVPDSLMVPTFQTMSGGLQMVFKNPEPSIPGAVRFMPGLDYRGEGSLAILPPSTNGNGGKYRWLDGLSLKEVEPPPLPASLLSLLINNNIYKSANKESNTESQLVTDNHNYFTEGRRDNDLFHTANCLVKGGMEKQGVDQVLERLILSWGENPDKKWIDAKIKSAMDRAARHDRNIAEEVRNFLEVTTGHFEVTDCHRESQIVTKEDKHAVIVELKRLCSAGIIEKYGTKRGCYRIIENDCEDIDFLSASTESVNIRWPFGIERLVKTLPKNIIIIAGEPNSGKTAFLLNTVKMNQADHRINYYSSEMGNIELRDRLSKFAVPLTAWKFIAKERASNFADVIKPDEINIIDFLEVHDEFYKIGGMIKEIYDKLKKGIAIIAIQKNRGNDYGLGGTRGLEKARLYLAMEPNRLKIIKGKNWTGTENPNGLAIDFKLAQGCKFIKESEWRKVTL